MTFDVSKIDSFPTQPGVYLMKNHKGEILYVGKANNLKQRVKQYFVPGRDGRFIVPFLVSKIDDIETIIVSSEKEALLVENHLIKQYQPRYNALLKDDKTYIALKITKQLWPKVVLMRYKGKPKADGTYFGPYTSAYSARRTLDLLQRLFPLRQCTDQEFANRSRPCILYDMKKCIAPCVGKCSKDEYDFYVEQTTKFLKGQNKDVLKQLYKQMHEASDRLEFEKAGEILQRIREVEQTIEAQNVDRPLGGDMDALGIFRQGDEVILSQLLFRSGKLSGARHHNFTQIGEDDQELFQSFILQFYEKQEELPHEILLPVLLGEQATLGEILSTNRTRKVYLATPQRGEKKALIDMARLNAEAAFQKDKDLKSIREKTLLQMQEQLRLSRYPKRIECFDNSSHGGTELVSALVAYTEGEKDKNRYRRYKLKTVSLADDYASMYEVLSRRYKRAKEENDLPDLIIVDGGKGHLNIANKILHELDIITVDLIGVAKEEGRHDKGITAEQIFLRDAKDPILLKKNSSILFLIQQIRDEAHRFAISYHRNLRTKKVIKSALDDIPGIGPVKKRALLKHFGSLKKIKEASKEELEKVAHLNSQDLITLQNFFSEKS